MAVAVQCSNHPRRASTASCWNCGSKLCGLCVIQTSKGDLCKPCAKGRPKEVSALEATREPFPTWFIVAAGLIVSLAGWAVMYGLMFYLGTTVGFGYIATLVVGVAVGSTVRFLSDGKTSFKLIFAAVLAVGLGRTIALLTVELYIINAFNIPPGLVSTGALVTQAIVGGILASISALFTALRLRL